jgi:DNA-binding NarL/FixJ family response regulator
MRKVRILIVDDHKGVRMSVRSLLECEQNFEVCGEAEDGAQGVNKAEELKPDVVVLNISMPVMSGVDAAPKIRRVSPHSKIVILSSHADHRLMQEARNVGAACYVLKGHAAQELVKAIYAAAEGVPTVQM